jgi:hypothetical protein
VRSIAAPVFNHRHEVEAAINVAGHASRLSMKRLKEACLPCCSRRPNRYPARWARSVSGKMARRCELLVRRERAPLRCRDDLQKASDVWPEIG